MEKELIELNSELEKLNVALGNLEKSTNTLLENIEDTMKSILVDNLTKEQEDKLREEHSKNYTGTDDDMPEAYENWLESLTLSEINYILK